ncbi:MAG: hypothetical protein KBA26_06665, partial [Candidatus Delongbacteria bacterium]|nr:hypothetical protein [Candidatus Delongbacteria bacterium]
MSSIVRFSTLMLLMRYVDIEFNGFWSLFLIIIAFYTTTHGGVLNGYLIRIPMFMERSRYRTCQSLHDQAMISLLMTLGLGIIGLGVYLSYQSSIDLSYFEILLLLLIAGLSYLTFYIEISFTAQNHYRAYSLWLGWTSLIQLILVLTGTTLGGRIGFCLGY